MPLNPDYATLAEMRHYVRITNANDTTDDAELGFAISAASRAIDRATRRQFGDAGVASARRYSALYVEDEGLWRVYVDDFMTQTGFGVMTDLDDDGTYETAVTSTYYRLRPIDADAVGWPWTHLDFTDTALFGEKPHGVQVTARWGWTAVPTTIKQACLLQAERFFKRRDAPYGIAGSPELGSELRLLAKVDPDVEVMLAPYTGVRA